MQLKNLKTKMKNKNIIIAVCALILIIVIIGLIYFNVKNSDSVIETENETENETEASGELGSYSLDEKIKISEFLERVPNPYTIIYTLKKEDCSQLTQEFDKKECNNGIDLINKAIAADDTNLCFDKSFDVSSRIYSICMEKIGIERINKNE